MIDTGISYIAGVLIVLAACLASVVALAQFARWEAEKRRAENRRAAQTWGAK